MAEKESSSSRFYACYLLCSLNPRYKGKHYIGFTVNPRRRIRQHNGELGQGAWRTHTKRPWDMVLCVHGFSSQTFLTANASQDCAPNFSYSFESNLDCESMLVSLYLMEEVEALQFEWAWQHPTRSLAVKEAHALIPSSVRGFKKQFFLLFTMLNCDKWSSMDLNVQFLSSKYIDKKKGCPGLPPHMGLCIAPVETLPCYVNGGDWESDDNGDTEFEKAEGERSELEKDLSLQLDSRDLMKEDLMQDFDSSALDCQVQMNEIEVEKFAGSSGSVQLPSDNAVDGRVGEGSYLLSGHWDMRTEVQFEGIKAKGRPLNSSLHVDALPSSFEFPIKEHAASEAHTSPITGKWVSRVLQCGGNQGDGRPAASINSILVDEPLSPFEFLGRSHSLQDASKRTKVRQKPLPNSLQFGGVDTWMGISSLNCTRELSPSTSSLPFEEGTLASDGSPFTALMEQHSVQQPSSIAKRCLGQKQRSRLPLLSENPLPLRELSNVGNHGETFQRAPRTPPCAQRVVVVIPDTPIAMSKEVIDLTDSPL